MINQVCEGYDVEDHNARENTGFPESYFKNQFKIFKLFTETIKELHSNVN